MHLFLARAGGGELFDGGGDSGGSSGGSGGFGGGTFIFGGGGGGIGLVIIVLLVTLALRTMGRGDGGAAGGVAAPGAARLEGVGLGAVVAKVHGRPVTRVPQGRPEVTAPTPARAGLRPAGTPVGRPAVVVRRQAEMRAGRLEVGARRPAEAGTGPQVMRMGTEATLRCLLETAVARVNG